ncbi:MAG: hypothetical protein R3E42_18400 [Burkholderiaceae bacterium]
MAAYLPCRVSLVEHDDGSLWLYTLNMDMMVKMGRGLPAAEGRVRGRCSGNHLAK